MRSACATTGCGQSRPRLFAFHIRPCVFSTCCIWYLGVFWFIVAYLSNFLEHLSWGPVPDYCMVVQIKAHRLLICSSYKRRRLLVFVMKCFHILEASNTKELPTFFREKKTKFLQILKTKAIGINATSLDSGQWVSHF